MLLAKLEFDVKQAVDEAKSAKSQMQKQSTWRSSMVESLRSSVHGIFADFDMPEEEDLGLVKGASSFSRNRASRARSYGKGD